MSTAPFERLTGKFPQNPMLLGGSLVLATLLLYGQVRHHEFLEYDDSQYVTENIHVRTGLNASNVVWAFTTFYQANWHPLTWLSHMVDCQLLGVSSGSQHLVNVALHAANVLLLFLLLQRATGALWRSFLVAALFAVHPLNVEAVAWVAERKTLLCTLFSLLTIAAYGWYVRRPDWKRYPVIVAGFSLALMSKPMAVSLPLVLLLLDYWPLERYADLPVRSRWLRLSVEKLPLFVMSAASSAITSIAAQGTGGTLADRAALLYSLRFGNAVVSYVRYIGKTLWPAKLAVFYPHPRQSLAWSEVIAAAVILAAITTAVLYFRRARYLAMGWFLFVITLIPVIGIVQVGHQAMADRYAYIPCIGLFIILAWGMSEVVQATAIPREVATVTALCLILAFAAATTHYLQYWQSGAKLFTQARVVAGRPDFFLEEPLADALYSDGQLDEAVQHYREACRLRPAYVFCHYNMAQILLKRHQFGDALEQYELALRLADSKGMAVSCLINSGKILLEFGDYKTAEMEFARALQIDPENNTALLLRQQALNQENSVHD
jgi:protein O-mannosyl-transferase